MNTTPFDLTTLPWKLYGTMPYAWRNAVSIELGLRFQPEIGPIPVKVPGSVQQALIDAEIAPDWRYDLNSRDLEWVEHRHWVYHCEIPGDLITEDNYTISFSGLDYAGWIYFNSTLIGSFSNSFIPHSFGITKNIFEENNSLQIIFKEPPRWLGQLGYTSKIVDWKPRFYYTWDWTARVVQTAISGSIFLINKEIPSLEIKKLHTTFKHLSQKGKINLHCIIKQPEQLSKYHYEVELTLTDGENNVIVKSKKEFCDCPEVFMSLCDLDVKGWFPNLYGEQPRYTLIIKLTSSEGEIFTQEERMIGFKEVAWLPCKGAPSGATPWICQVNDIQVFLQGINWTPVSPTFSDVPFCEVKKRLLLYKEMGVNLLRVWGGAVLESEKFYDECTRLGLMVWQELPLSSSGIDNWPPEDKEVIEGIATIAKSYIKLRSHHVSLLMYSGGNELQGGLDGTKKGTGKPVDFTHPMMKELKVIFDNLDSNRRFIPTSPFGPRFNADQEDYNKGLHWSVHGPWNVDTVLDQRWTEYWQQDDSLLRAETGCPGAMNLEVLKSYVPSMSTYPVEQSNPVWGRTSWWIESHIFEKEKGHLPSTAEEYVAWSQERQSRALEIAARITKNRFPSTGGIIIWMGHDSYPCAANTSIIDIDGNPKPAFYALKKVFRA
ncbi:MAG: hypothetical protein JJE17_06430 [Peptostreptococcaceae bacterium]|nr:hypothetical protein [Peptostreptococcaceae bacterium]